MPASRFRCAAVILALALAGCGQTGDLVLPDKPEKPVASVPGDQDSDADRKRGNDDEEQD